MDPSYHHPTATPAPQIPPAALRRTPQSGTVTGQFPGVSYLNSPIVTSPSEATATSSPVTLPTPAAPTACGVDRVVPVGAKSGQVDVDPHFRQYMEATGGMTGSVVSVDVRDIARDLGYTMLCARRGTSAPRGGNAGGGVGEQSRGGLLQRWGTEEKLEERESKLRKVETSSVRLLDAIMLNKLQALRLS